MVINDFCVKNDGSGNKFFGLLETRINKRRAKAVS